MLSKTAYKGIKFIPCGGEISTKHNQILKYDTDHVRRKCDGRWLLSGHMVSGKEHGETACVLRTDQFGWAVASGMVLP